MKTARYCITIMAAFVLSGCSWVERFFIVNQGEPVSIEIKLRPNSGNFPIFDHRMYTYPVGKKGVNCEKPTELTPAFTNKEKLQYTFTLPANTAVEIGRLHNDKYEKYDQVFINDRTFNLEWIILKQEGKEITRIVPSNFDSYFKKSRGEILLRLN